MWTECVNGVCIEDVYRWGINRGMQIGEYMGVWMGI